MENQWLVWVALVGSWAAFLLTWYGAKVNDRRFVLEREQTNAMANKIAVDMAGKVESAALIFVKQLENRLIDQEKATTFLGKRFDTISALAIDTAARLNKTPELAPEPPAPTIDVATLTAVADILTRAANPEIAYPRARPHGADNPSIDAGAVTLASMTDPDFDDGLDDDELDPAATFLRDFKLGQTIEADPQWRDQAGMFVDSADTDAGVMDTFGGEEGFPTGMEDQ